MTLKDKIDQLEAHRAESRRLELEIASDLRLTGMGGLPARETVPVETTNNGVASVPAVKMGRPAGKPAGKPAKKMRTVRAAAQDTGVKAKRRKRAFFRLPDDVRRKAEEMLKAGATRAAVSREVGISVSSVDRIREGVGKVVTAATGV